MARFNLYIGRIVTTALADLPEAWSHTTVIGLPTYSNGDKTVTGSDGIDVGSTTERSSGKWYVEVSSTGDVASGLIRPPIDDYVNRTGIELWKDGYIQIYTEGDGTPNWSYFMGDMSPAGGVVGWAVDLDEGRAWMRYGSGPWNTSDRDQSSWDMTWTFRCNMSDSDRTAAPYQTNSYARSNRWNRDSKVYAEVVFADLSVGTLSVPAGMFIGPTDTHYLKGARLLGNGDVKTYTGVDGDLTTYSGVFPVLGPNDIIGIAVDGLAGKVWFRVNGGDWNNNGLVAATGYTVKPNEDYRIVVYISEDDSATIDASPDPNPTGYSDWYGDGDSDAWDSSNPVNDGHVIFSDDDKTVTAGPDIATTIYQAEIFSVTGHDSGKRFVSVTFAGDAIGIVSSDYENGVYVNDVGGVYHNSSPPVIEEYYPDTFPPLVAGDVVDIAIDIDTGLVWLRVNGSDWNNNANTGPVIGDGGISIDPDTLLPIYWGGTQTVNGMRGTLVMSAPFTHAAPSGYLEWNDPTNLPSPVTGSGGFPIASADYFIWTQLSYLDNATINTGNTFANVRPSGFTPWYGSGGSITDVDVSGLLLTVSAGNVAVTVTSTATVGVSGMGLTSSLGDEALTFSSNLNVSSQVATANVGTATVTGLGRVDLTGQGVAVSVGSATASGKAQATVAGASVSVLAGTASVTGKASIEVTSPQMVMVASLVSISTANNASVGVAGFSTTASVGDVTVNTFREESVALTGQQVSASVGTVTLVGKASASVDGQESTVGLEPVSVRVNQTVTITTAGLMTASVGSAVASISTIHRPTGYTLTASAGQPLLSLSYRLAVASPATMTVRLGRAFGGDRWTPVSTAPEEVWTKQNP